MAQSIVSIDIETTGLDPARDAIIEIGAVRFNGKRVESEWTTLVNPGRPITPFITQLTGITNEMVRNAPPIKAVIGELAGFVGFDPVLGHSVRFDLSFLQRNKILQNNTVLDTYELASVLMPTSSRYNLGALGQILGILLPATHRALDDARVTHAVYQQLFQQAMELPIELIKELILHSEPLDWGGTWVLQQVLRARASQPIPAKSGRDLRPRGPSFSDSDYTRALTPINPTRKLDIDEVSSILEYGGPFANYFQQYEFRTHQVEMLRAVTNAFNESQHLMVEAGTGTGKSFAYLVPAALWAIQNGLRVVISTNTINLQEQLIQKDIPDLRNALQLDLRAVVMKGRSNYLCPHRLAMMRRSGPKTVEEMRVLGKILTWLQTSQTGDRGEINLNGPIERDVWMRLSAEDESCRPESCVHRSNGTCPFYNVRQAMQAAHLIIVNHALLLADIATGSRLLPEYQYLLIDEAHHIESATTSALSYRVTHYDLQRMLLELGGRSSGIFARTLTQLAGDLRPSEMAAMNQLIERATDQAFRLEHSLAAFFTSFNEFLTEQREGQPVGSYGHQERIIPSTRTQPTWTNVEMTWDETHETMILLINLLGDLHKALGELITMPVSSAEALQETQDILGTVFRRLSEANENINNFIMKPSNEMIYWAEISASSNTLSLQIAPLHIGSLMEQHLWHEKASIILTSATLATNDGFDYIRRRLNADEAAEVQVGSPFDYENAALLYLANDIPEPADANNYQRILDQTIVRLARATGGRMLTLFTSYAQLKRTSQSITPALMNDEITVYEQGEGASAAALLDNFKGSEKAVLLGTRSFWEGVDVPGEALSVLVIVKLPFDVPTDPIIAARSETFEDAFNEYQLPEAILRFRQGFGRLIRTASDRGIVVVLDRRILTKRYGKSFLEALPECKKKIGPVSDLPGIAAKWLNL